MPNPSKPKTDPAVSRAEALGKQQRATGLAAVKALQELKIPALTTHLAAIESILTSKPGGPSKADDQAPAGRSQKPVLHVRYNGAPPPPLEKTLEKLRQNGEQALRGNAAPPTPALSPEAQAVRNLLFPLEQFARRTMDKLNGDQS